MPEEYEIKFVLRDDDLEERLRNFTLEDPSWNVMLIEQHYLSKAARIRKATTLIRHGNDFGKAGDVIHQFAYKPKVNGAVVEIETDISEDDFRLILPKTQKSLVKVRYQEEKPCSNEHWLVDFFKHRKQTYFVLAECEMYGKIKEYKRMPEFVAESLVLTAKHEDSRFKSRTLCDIVKAAATYEKIVGGTYVEEKDAPISS